MLCIARFSYLSDPGHFGCKNLYRISKGRRRVGGR